MCKTHKSRSVSADAFASRKNIKNRVTAASVESFHRVFSCKTVQLLQGSNAPPQPAVSRVIKFGTNFGVDS